MPPDARRRSRLVRQAARRSAVGTPQSANSSATRRCSARQAVGLHGHPVGAARAGKVDVGHPDAQQLAHEGRHDPEPGFLDDDGDAAGLAQPRDGLLQAAEIPVPFRLEQLLAGVQVHDERLRLQALHDGQQGRDVPVTHLHGADVGEHRDVGGNWLHVEVRKELGVLQEDADGPEADGNAELLGGGGKLAVGLEPALRAAGHAGNEKRKRYRWPRKDSVVSSSASAASGRALWTKRTPANPASPPSTGNRDGSVQIVRCFSFLAPVRELPRLAEVVLTVPILAYAGEQEGLRRNNRVFHQARVELGLHRAAGPGLVFLEGRAARAAEQRVQVPPGDHLGGGGGDARLEHHHGVARAVRGKEDPLARDPAAQRAAPVLQEEREGRGERPGVEVADPRKRIYPGREALLGQHGARLLRVVAEHLLEELFHGGLRHVAKRGVQDEVVGLQEGLLGPAARARTVVQERRLEAFPVAAHGVAAVHPRRDGAEGTEEIIDVRGEVSRGCQVQLEQARCGLHQERNRAGPLRDLGRGLRFVAGNVGAHDDARVSRPAAGGEHGGDAQQGHGAARRTRAGPGSWTGSPAAGCRRAGACPGRTRRRAWSDPRPSPFPRRGGGRSSGRGPGLRSRRIRTAEAARVAQSSQISGNRMAF